jgi:hypothetical protein
MGLEFLLSDLYVCFICAKREPEYGKEDIILLQFSSLVNDDLVESYSCIACRPLYLGVKDKVIIFE